MTLRTALAFLFMLIGSTAPGASQTAQQPSQPIRTEAELVTVDVVVVDRRGEPVTDLAPTDFTVLEDGKPQAVQLFQVMGTVKGTAHAAQATPRRYRYSTNVGAPSTPGRSFVLFFDDVHLTQELGERIKAAVTRFLGQEVRSGDLVSLVAPGRALRWHARAPDGLSELSKALASLRGMNLPEITHERISDYEAYRIHVMHDEQMAERVGRRFSNLRVAGRDPIDLQRDEGPRPEKKGGTAGLIEPLVMARAAEAYARATVRNRATLGSLIDTIEAMTAVRGRKAIIVLSPGFIMDQELPLFRQVEDAAVRANIAVYFVDARGLEVQSVFGSAQFGSPLDSRDVGAANADLTLEAEGAAALAEASGGFSVQNRNDLAAGLARIGRESQAYYLLGYAPAGRPADGKFRRISVRVNRPAVEVRARKGYYAGGVRRMVSEHPTADALQSAVESPFELGGLPIRATAYVFGSVNANQSSVLVAVEADLRSFQLAETNGALTDVLDLQLLVTDPGSGETKRYERAIEMTLPGGVPKAESSAWYPVSQELELAPGRYQARVAVRDRNSGRVGAVTHHFEVPERKGMTVSSLIVTDTIEKAEEPSAAPPKPVLIVRRLLPAGTTLYYQFLVFDAGRTPAGETRVKAGHMVRRAGGDVIKAMMPTTLLPGPTGMSRFAGVSLAGIPAGEYELVVTVADEVRGETVEVVETFAIAEPQEVKVF